ncbi:MAG: hypothetical protein RL326_913 [Pseudomonadota bacterium]|jgi:hypothetical protein
MRKPDQICRVCQQISSLSSYGEVCSTECAERLSETEYYELELVEAVAELNGFEEGVYLPLFLKLARAEAQLKFLENGMGDVSRSDHLAETPSDSLEVREWKKAQREHDTWALSLVKSPLRRLRRKVRLLGEELREIDQRWQSLSDRREAMLQKLSKARGD